MEELFKREIDEVLAAGLEALKSDYHKLWDMPALYAELVAENPLLGMMPSMFMTSVYKNIDDPENLLYQFGLNQFDPVPSMIRKPLVDLYDKSNDLRYVIMEVYGKRIEDEKVRSLFLVNLLDLTLQKGYSDQFPAYVMSVRRLITDLVAIAQLPRIEARYREA